MKVIASFIGKNRDFRAWLAAQLYPNKVIYLQSCSLKGGWPILDGRRGEKVTVWSRDSS